MADQNPREPGLFSSLRLLATQVRDVVQTIRLDTGLLVDPMPDLAGSEEPAPPLALPAPDEHSESAQLLTQHTPGWHTPRPSTLPVPSYAPAMTAFGIVFIALGAVTQWPLSVIGAVIFVLAIAKWIGELLHA